MNIPEPISEGVGIVGNILATPVAGYTVGGILVAGGIVGAGIYFVGKWAKGAFQNVL